MNSEFKNLRVNLKIQCLENETKFQNLNDLFKEVEMVSEDHITYGLLIVLNNIIKDKQNKNNIHKPKVSKTEEVKDENQNNLIELLEKTNIFLKNSKSRSISHSYDMNNKINNINEKKLFNNTIYTKNYLNSDNDMKRSLLISVTRINLVILLE